MHCVQIEVLYADMDTCRYVVTEWVLFHTCVFQPKLYMNAHGERIAQCQHIKLITTASLPVQIDGEACKLKPSVIEVVLQNKAIMIKKAPLRSVNAPLRGYVTPIHMYILCGNTCTFYVVTPIHMYVLCDYLAYKCQLSVEMVYSDWWLCLVWFLATLW